MLPDDGPVWSKNLGARAFQVVVLDRMEMNMSTKVVLVLLVLALVAAAGTVTKLGVYQVTLSRPAAVNGITLKPGDYT